MPFLKNLQGTTVRLFPVLVNFVTAAAYHFCLNLPAAFSQPQNGYIVKPCTLLPAWSGALGSRQNCHSRQSTALWRYLCYEIFLSSVTIASVPLVGYVCTQTKGVKRRLPKSTWHPKRAGHNGLAKQVDIFHWVQEKLGFPVGKIYCHVEKMFWFLSHTLMNDHPYMTFT